MSTVATTQRPQRRAVALAIQFPAVRTVPRDRHHVGFRPYATVRTERTVTCGLTTVRPTRATHMNRIKPSHDFRALGWIVAWSYPEGVPVCAPPVGARALPRCPWQRFVYGQADEVRVGVAGPPPALAAARPGNRASRLPQPTAAPGLARHGDRVPEARVRGLQPGAPHLVSTLPGGAPASTPDRKSAALTAGIGSAAALMCARPALGGFPLFQLACDR